MSAGYRARAPQSAATTAAPGGFTLLEVMVALAILSIALIAALRSGALGTQYIGEIRLRLVADWVAQDRIEEHRARRDWLPVGNLSGETIQAGMQFRWEEKISGTPNTQFRRIDVSVFQAEGSDKNHALTQFTSFLVKPGG